MSTLFHRSLFCLSLLTLLAGAPLSSFGQCETKALDCEQHMFPYNSDGDYYRAELYPGESAKVSMTFYSGMVYRIIPCGTSSADQDLVFLVEDQRGVVVYDSRELPGQDYYDVSFGATGTYKIQSFFKDKKGEGCAAILIGYLDEATAIEDEFIFD